MEADNYGAVSPTSSNDIKLENLHDVEAMGTKEISSSQPGKRTGTLALLFTALMASTALIALTAGPIRSRFYQTNSLEASSIAWSLRRTGYETLDYFTSSVLSYPLLAGYDAVIEPHANMELYIDGYNKNSDYYYTMEVCSANGFCKTGNTTIENENVKYNTVSFPCASPEAFDITVRKYNSVDILVSTKTGSGICKYVRREIRDLTDDDRDKTMDAMFALWSYSDEEGQELYGSEFHNSTFFIAAHHFNAAWRDSDHIHEGLGFLPQHLKITNMFEKSMQSVDPSVTLPYWDFTIDAGEVDTIFKCYPFTSKLFGSVNKPADQDWGWTYRNDSIIDAAIPNGRWKHLKVDINYNYPDLDYNFGYLRAPWNMNPSPYVSRFSAYTTELPSCADHFKLLEYDVLTDFLSAVPYSPHASVHGAIGSVYGCDMMDAMTEQGLILDDDAQNLLCQKWGFMMKELFRKNYISSGENCYYSELKYDKFHCSYECNPDKYDSMTKQLKALIGSQYVGTLSEEQWEDWRDFVCTGDGSKIFVGDHVESASPADPSFWPIHPTLERVLHAKYLSGGFEDNSWPSNAEKDYVCDKAQCYENGDYDYYDACCYGHYQDDQLLDFVNGDKSSGYGPTNSATMADTDPSEDYNLPYIYDGFTWNHCDEDFEGYFKMSLEASD